MADKNMDFTHLSEDEKINGIKITNVPQYIREKAYLTDFSETLAQLAEMIIQLGVNLSLDPDEALEWARKLQESVSQSEFDSWVATLLDGGPSLFFETKAALIAKYPNGAPGVALVRETDPAKIYVWNGKAWEDFGDYQGIEIRNGSVTSQKISQKAVTPDKLSFPTNKASSPSTNLFNKDAVVKGEYVRWDFGDYGTHASYSRSEMIPVVPNEQLTIAIAEQIAFRDSMYNYISGMKFNETTQTITVPAGIRYMEINTPINSLNKQQINRGSVLLDYESYYPKVANDNIADLAVSPNKTTFFDMQAVNLFDGAEISIGEYVRWDIGDIGQNANTLYFKTAIKPQTKYERSHLGQIAYFDSLGNYIGGVEDGDVNVDYQVTTPLNASIAYINVNIVDKNQYYFKEASNYTKFTLKREFLPGDANTKRVSSIISQLVLSDRTLNVKIIGDSITAGVGGTGYATDGEIIYGTYRVNTNGHCWANSLKEYYESKFNVSVKNFGVSGRNSWDLLVNLDQIIHTDDDIIICMIGTNDRNNESRGGIPNSKQAFYSNLKAIYEYVKARGKEIIFMSNIPASVTNENLDRVFHMEDVDAIVNKLASDYGLEYVSLYKLFMDYCKNNNVTIDSLLKDGLHPNDAGYDVMFYLITNALGIGAKRDGANW